MRSDKKFQSRTLIQVTIQAADEHSAERRWKNALEALNPSRYPGLKLDVQVEPYWTEVKEDDASDRLDTG